MLRLFLNPMEYLLYFDFLIVLIVDVKSFLKNLRKIFDKLV